MKTKLKISPAKIILILSLLIGFVLRIYMLDSIPQGFNWDEASVTYNAYSLSQTGRDEFGKPWPLIIESFGDYKTGIYSILLAPIIKIFGLSIFIARIPNVFVGLAVILASYYLARAIFKDELSASIVALLISISPWAIHTSRFVLEWHLGLPLVITGGFFLLESKNKPIKLIWAAIFLASSMYFYHSIRLFSPLLALGFLLINNKWAKKNWRMIVTAALTAVIFLLPLIITAFSSDLFSRPSAVSIFSDGNIETTNEGIYRETVLNMPWFRIYNNSVSIISYKFTTRYLSHFSPQFLFLGEDASPRLGIEGVGKLYLTSLPFMLLGIFIMLKKRKSQDLFLIFWLLIAPIASSLTKDSPHSLRSLIFLPIFQIITVSGMRFFYLRYKDKNIRKKQIIIVFVVLSYFLSLGFFLNKYLLFYPEDAAIYWQDGYKEMVEEVNKHQDDFSQVIVTNDYGQPHIFFAVFTPIDPNVYQQEVTNQQEKFNSRVSQIGKIVFTPINPSHFCEENTLIVSSGKNADKDLPRMKIIYGKSRFQEKKVIFEFFDTNNSFIRTKLCE